MNQLVIVLFSQEYMFDIKDFENPFKLQTNRLYYEQLSQVDFKES